MFGFSVLLLLTQPVLAVATPAETKFAGKIIRSLSVEASRILVGLKGGQPGTALVYESQDSGRTWRGLNGGRSLSPQATDVQAVAAIGAVIFAGTWKHGLFVSRDGGATFQHQAGFPSNDIRSVRVVSRGKDSVVYAATARDGVFRSHDRGASWTALGPGRDFFWSRSADEERVYAVSLETAIYRQTHGAKSWEKIFDQDDAYSLASDSNGERLAVAAQTGAYHSQDSGKSWQRVALSGREKLSSVLYLKGGSALFGSWSNGLIRVGSENGAARRILQKTAVLHLALSGETLVVGTWGAGLKLLPLGAVLK
ncbi:MAG: hypothetical protein OXR03_15615 [Rhodospirillaceae bacterium]|nr:hypothetical protein [Rhodospirillaceae bacterium]